MINLSDMRNRNRFFAGALVLAALTGSAFGADNKKKAKPLTAAEVFKRSVPAIVGIDCMGPGGAKLGTATGFVVAENGKIVTNYHVIQPCSNVTTRLSNGDIYDTANVIDTDARRDLALIRIKAVSLPVLPLADSNSVEVGAMVFSIGNPNGLQNTLQQGLVSGFREMDGYRLMQVSASINPGNSGGPILDDQGQVIAISKGYIKDAENLGFAVPINYAKGYLDSKTETSFAVFSLRNRVAATTTANAAGPATSASSGGVAGGVPGGIPGGVPGGVVGGVLGGVAPPPPPPPPPPVRSEGTRPPAAPVFGRIETIAGRDYRFTGEGLAAREVQLGRIYGVASDREGNIFAADRGNQAIVKIGAEGRLHILAGPDSAQQNRPFVPLSIAVAPSGEVYFGEDGQRVRKVLPSGEVVVIAGANQRGFTADGSPAAGSPIGNVSGLALAADGAVYFSEGSNHRVRRVDPQGRLETVAGDGQARFAGDGGPANQASIRDPANLAFDAAGNLYIADRGNGRVRKVGTDGKISTVVGGGVTKDPLNCPMGVAVNSKGEVFASDPCRRRVLVVRDGESSVFAGNGSPNGVKEPSGTGGPAIAASFEEWGLSFNEKDGGLLIAGPDSGYIYKVDPQGGFSVIAGSGDWRIPADGTLAKNAFFRHPSHLTVDRSGTVFFTEIDTNRIYRVDAAGSVTKVAGNGRAVTSGDSAVAKDSGINTALGVGVRANGTLVFSERGGSNRIREITPDGKLRTLAGNGRAEYSGDGGRATNAALNAPMGIAVDGAGNTYIADTENQRVRKVTPDGNIQLVAGNGMKGFSGDGGPAERASLNTPVAVSLGPDGSLYIADQGNRRVRKVLNGTITTIAGDGANRFAGDGAAAMAASFIAPADLAFGPDRALYVLDVGAVRVRRIDADGKISTVAGNGVRAMSGDGGAPALAGLGQPEGLAIDAAGNLYLTESQTGRIREVRLGGANSGSGGQIGQGSANQGLTTQAPATPGQPIQIGTDRMETFLRGKIGMWGPEDAKVVLGKVKEQHPQLPGEVLSFDLPGSSFASASLVFDAKDKLVSVDFTVLQKPKWDPQLAFMKTKFPGDDFKLSSSDGNSIYRFDRSKTIFLVQPDGSVAKVTIF
jgi:S1-C subfamily serine protease/sugar lactone lactonase YvrE